MFFELGDYENWLYEKHLPCHETKAFSGKCASSKYRDQQAKPRNLKRTIMHPYNLLYPITDNPLYTDTRYNDKIRYNNNLNGTKPSLKR